MIALCILIFQIKTAGAHHCTQKCVDRAPEMWMYREKKGAIICFGKHIWCFAFIFREHALPRTLVSTWERLYDYKSGSIACSSINFTLQKFLLGNALRKQGHFWEPCFQHVDGKLQETIEGYNDIWVLHIFSEQTDLIDH